MNQIHELSDILREIAEILKVPKGKNIITHAKEVMKELKKYDKSR